MNHGQNRAGVIVWAEIGGRCRAIVPLLGCCLSAVVMQLYKVEITATLPAILSALSGRPGEY
jgi:hypothetical protein